MTNRQLMLLIGVLLTACCALSVVGSLIVIDSLRSSSSADIIVSPLPPTVSPVALSTRVRSNRTNTPGFTTLTPLPSPSASATSIAALPTHRPFVSAIRAPSPTRATRDPYDVQVPTPNAPDILYPITFDSSLKVITYPITGTTERELSSSLNASALPDPHEQVKRYYARTDWFLSAHWNWKPAGGRCEVSGGDISLAMTMTVPVLASRQLVSSSVLGRWDTFLENTMRHETGHISLDLEGARSYQADLGNFAPAADCGTLKSELKALFDDNFSKMDKANVDYDDETIHGIKQGAVYPPK